MRNVGTVSATVTGYNNDPATVTPPVEPEVSTVTAITKAGHSLYAVTVMDEDGVERTLIVSAGVISMTTVRLSVEAAAILWRERRGATPLAQG